MKAKIEYHPKREDDYKQTLDGLYTAALMLIGSGDPSDVRIVIHHDYLAVNLAQDLIGRGLNVVVMKTMMDGPCGCQPPVVQSSILNRLWPCGASHHDINTPCDCPRED